MARIRSIGVFLAALALGLLIYWVDSRPTWDDTGITAGAIFIGSALFGAAYPARPWRWALAVGGWIPAVSIVIYHDYKALLVLVFALSGAYAGALARKALTHAGGIA